MIKLILEQKKNPDRGLYDKLKLEKPANMQLIF
jgi:hypothetical protein